MRRTITSAVITSAVLVLAAPLVIAAFASGKPDPSSGAQRSGQARVPTAVPASVARSVKALRALRAVRAPRAVTTFARRPYVARQFAPNPALSRAVTPAGAESPWYIMPGDNSVCLSTADTSTCGSVEEVKAGQLAVFVVEPSVSPQGKPISSRGTVRVFGVAPDGVESAQVVSGDGRLITRPVVDSVYDLEGADLKRLVLHKTTGEALTIRAG